MSAVDISTPASCRGAVVGGGSSPQPEQALEPRANNALIESKSNVFGEFMVSRDIER